MGVSETIRPFPQTLEAIAAGSLDPAPAEDPQLDDDEAPEILWMIV